MKKVYSELKKLLKKQDAKGIDRLIKKYPDFYKEDWSVNTIRSLILNAYEGGSVECVRLLLKNIPDPKCFIKGTSRLFFFKSNRFENHSTNIKMGPLCYAIEKGLTELVEETIKYDHFPLNVGEEGPLITAMRMGNAKIFGLLVKKAKNLNFNFGLADCRIDCTPLFYAIEKEYMQMATFLASNPKVDPNMGRKAFMETRETTPLYFCAEKGYTELVRILCSRYELDVNRVSYGGKKAKDVSATKEIYQIIEHRENIENEIRRNLFLNAVKNSPQQQKNMNEDFLQPMLNQK